MNNIWDQEEDFRDMPEAALASGDRDLNATVAGSLAGSVTPGTSLPSNQPKVRIPVRPDEDQDELSTDEISAQNSEESEEDDYSEVLSDARLRLEQGRLYEMIMNNDLFGGMDTDAKAAKHVQREIKKFAKERMEIMLGMRQEEMAKQYAEYNGTVGSPFNELEITLLKQLASKVSGGKTEAQSEDTKREEPVKKNTINKINLSTPPKKLPAVSAKPISRPKPAIKMPEIIQEEKPLAKDPSLMPREELAERNRRIEERQAKLRTAKPKNALPQATYEQQHMIYNQQAAAASDTVSTIVHLMNTQRKN